jgi:hypothetical protein
MSTSVFLKTEVREPGSCETLYMEVAYHHNGGQQVIYIGVIEKNAVDNPGVISLQIADFSCEPCQFGHMWITKKEINLIIKGLRDAKARMKKYKKKVYE